MSKFDFKRYDSNLWYFWKFWGLGKFFWGLGRVVNSKCLEKVSQLKPPDKTPIQSKEYLLKSYTVFVRLSSIIGLCDSIFNFSSGLFAFFICSDSFLLLYACITSYLQPGVDDSCVVTLLAGVLRADTGAAGVLTGGAGVLTAWGAGDLTAVGSGENTSSQLISSAVFLESSWAGEFASAIDSRLDCLLLTK